jgi:tetratricopeptide (TPR) repeat protein
MALGNLASVIGDEGKNAEAEKLNREIFEARRRTLGPDHPDTALAMFNLADSVAQQHRYPEAIALYRQMLEIERRRLGPGAPMVLDTSYCLASSLALDGQPEEALAVLRNAVDAGLPVKTHNYNLETDTDFKSLHGDARFGKLVADAKNRPRASGK